MPARPRTPPAGKTPAKARSSSSSSSSNPTVAATWQDANQLILDALDLPAEFAALGIDLASDHPSQTGWLECWAIDRPRGNSPSAGVNALTGRYKDHGGDGENLSFWELAARLHPFPNWKTAREHYAAKAGIALPSPSAGGKSKTSRDPAQHLHFLPWNETLISLWCRRKPPIIPAAIQAAGGRLARYRGQYTTIAVPIWGPALQDADPIGWVLWNVTGGTLPVFRGKGRPVEQVKMKTTGGSQAGLILLGQTQIENCTVWKTEGPTDALALWGSVPPDFCPSNPIITNAGGANQWPLDWMAVAFADRQVFLIHDADQPGETGGVKWTAWLAPIASDLRWPRLPYPIEPTHGRDLRDFLTEHQAAGDGWQALRNLSRTSPDLHSDIPRAVGVTTINPDASPDASLNASPDASPVVQEADDDPHRLARVYLDAHGRELSPPHRLTLRYWREEWWQWRGTHYLKLSDSNLRALVSASAKAEFNRQNLLAQQLSAASQDGKLPNVHKVTRPLVSNIIGALESITVVNWINSQPAWIGPLDNSTGSPNCRSSPNYCSMANGMLDVDKLAEWIRRDMADELAESELNPAMEEFLQPHTPEWFSSVAVPYEFDPSADCPVWKKALDENLEGDVERIGLLQEWAGYCLLPSTSYQRFLVLEGEGSNGKSVYLAGLTAILGSENVSNISLELYGTRFVLTDTIGKLANICGDCGEIDKVAEGHLKSFASGDRMFFDRKGIPGLNTVPTARLTMACNNRPRFTDRSGGIWRRMLLVPFLREVPAPSVVRGMDQTDYWYTINEAPGMFCWAVAGLARLRQQAGFSNSQICSEAIEDYKQEINPAKAFLQEFCEENSLLTVPSKDLYSGYKKWCSDSGYRPLGDRQFGKEVMRAFRGVLRKRGGSRVDRFWYYEGLDYNEPT